MSECVEEGGWRRWDNDVCFNVAFFVKLEEVSSSVALLVIDDIIFQGNAVDEIKFQIRNMSLTFSIFHSINSYGSVFLSANNHFISTALKMSMRPRIVHLVQWECLPLHS